MIRQCIRGAFALILAAAAPAVIAGGICDPGTTDLVVHDDGIAESGYGWGELFNSGRRAGHFTPAAYPATVTTVCAGFFTFSSTTTTLPFQIAVYDDDGAGGAPGTELGRMSFTTTPLHTNESLFPQAIPFEAFDISGMGVAFASGSVYVSIEWDVSTFGVSTYLAVDESAGTPLNVGYQGYDGGPWTPIAADAPDYRALFLRAVMPVAAPSAPGLRKQFAPTAVDAGEPSTLTISLTNITQSSAAVLSSPLVDTLPAGMVVAASPNASTTCPGGSVIATPGGGSVTLGAGAQIPASGECAVSVDVSAGVDGTYLNSLSAGALVTQFGSNAQPATATLTVGLVFPAPYCPINVASDVEPITRVVFADIDNASDPAVSGSPALEDFTAIVGHVLPGQSVTIAVEGNTAGDYQTPVIAYIDWNQDALFDDATERYSIGVLSNSTGTDGQQVTATIAVPVGAALGQTRLRVIKNYDTEASSACDPLDYGQTEDYTLQIGAEYTVTPSVVAGSGSITPATPQTVLQGSTLAFTLTPGPGFAVAGVGGSCGGSLNAGTGVFTTVAITANCSVEASFVAVAAAAPAMVPATDRRALLLLFGVVLGVGFAGLRRR